MKMFLLIITLMDKGETTAIEFNAGVLATPELCQMAGEAIAKRLKNPQIDTGFRCVPAEGEAV